MISTTTKITRHPMQRYNILHRTYYNFGGNVTLGPHHLRLRPREGPDLRIESSSLQISPTASLEWHRDVEDNSIAVATFAEVTNQLMIESTVVVQQYNRSPHDFTIDSEAIHYPFFYSSDDYPALVPYLDAGEPSVVHPLAQWTNSQWRQGESIPTRELLQRLCSRIHQSFNYQVRMTPGVQSTAETLSRRTGTCRDFAHLFMLAVRRLGMAARFVSGYLQVPPSATDLGSTHAWVEVYLPGAGWTGFDPTIGDIAGTAHIAVSVARNAESVPPVSGTFVGPPGSNMEVGVWISELS